MVEVLGARSKKFELSARLSLCIMLKGSSSSVLLVFQLIFSYTTIFVIGGSLFVVKFVMLKLMMRVTKKNETSTS